MWRQTLKIAVRNLFKQKLYTSINIFGLAIGLAGSLLIAVFVWNELSYENMHGNADRIYRVSVRFGQGGQGMVLAGAMRPLGPALKEDMAEVEDFTRIRFIDGQKISVDGEEKPVPRIFSADASIFDIFDIEIIEGNYKTSLNEVNNAFISQEFAKTLFGDENPMNKSFIYNGEIPVKISGVYRNPEGNTQIYSDLIISYKTIEAIDKTEYPWGNFGQDLTYVLLNKEMPLPVLKEKCMAVLEKNTNEQFAQMIQFVPEKFSDIYLKSQTRGDLIEHGNINYVYLFSTIAVLVLLIACFNFINLSTARSIKRAKEVGIKKVLGAARFQLIKQFLMESILLTFISLLIGVFLFELFYPLLNEFLGVEMKVSHFQTIDFYLIIAVIFFIVALLSGIYPSFYITNSIRLRQQRGLIEFIQVNSVSVKCLL